MAIFICTSVWLALGLVTWRLYPSLISTDTSGKQYSWGFNVYFSSILIFLPLEALMAFGVYMAAPKTGLIAIGVWLIGSILELLPRTSVSDKNHSRLTGDERG